MRNPETYKGIDLLLKIFEFTSMTPDKTEWNAAALKDNMPCDIRFLQIEALVRAFLGPVPAEGFIGKTKEFFTPKEAITIQAVLAGEFLKTRTVSDHADLFAIIKEVVPERNFDPATKTGSFNLVMPYQHLIRYGQLLHGVLTFNSGWLEASALSAQFSIGVIEDVNRHIYGNHIIIDRALEAFINPDHKSFTKAELVAKYGYPTEDLWEIDMENY